MKQQRRGRCWFSSTLPWCHCNLLPCRRLPLLRHCCQSSFSGCLHQCAWACCWRSVLRPVWNITGPVIRSVKDQSNTAEMGKSTCSISWLWPEIHWNKRNKTTQMQKIQESHMKRIMFKMFNINPKHSSKVNRVRVRLTLGYMFMFAPFSCVFLLQDYLLNNSTEWVWFCL